jgi:hypothetical protein
MNLLLLGHGARPRRLLKKLLGDAGHAVDWLACEDLDCADPSRYDLVIVDGEVAEGRAQAELVEMLDLMRARNRRVPIAVLSWVDADGAHGSCRGSVCGLHQGPGGRRESRCRLRELAFSETAALLRHVAESDPLEPVTFVYQG